MSGPRGWLPAAERDEHEAIPDLTFAATSAPKGCLHTTEGSTWPSYRGWKVTPHGTVMPTPGKGVVVRQHIPLERPGLSLANEPGGVQTNRERVWQWELIGTCEPGGPGYFWPDADDKVLLDLWDKVIEPCSKRCGIPLRAKPFQAYPPSYGRRGKTNTVRMSPQEWVTWSGWLGHQHVPENNHGDPGAFPWTRMVRAVARRRSEREDPFMALTKADAELLTSVLAPAIADAVAAKLLGWDTIPDRAAVRRGADPKSAEGTVSMRTLAALALENLQQKPPAP